MINVTFHDYKKLSSLFTIVHVVAVVSFSSLTDVSMRIKFFKVSVYKFFTHFPSLLACISIVAHDGLVAV